MNVEITRFVRKEVHFEKAVKIATFDAMLGDFRIRSGSVWRSHETGTLSVTLPGRRAGYTDGGITLKYGATRLAVDAAALAAYEASST